MNTSRKLLISCIIVLTFFLASCAAPGANSNDTSAIMQKTFSPTSTTNTIAIVDNKMFYQTIDINSSTFCALDLVNGKTTAITTLSNYVMDSGSAVVSGDSVYKYITVADDNGYPQNELYHISCSDFSMERIFVDKECAPLISLYQVPVGLLALKISDSKTYFDLFTESNQSSNVVLEAPKSETFVTATVSDDTLFVFAYAQDSNGGYDYFIRKYTLDGYDEMGVISLDNIEKYIVQARIAEMDVLGDYLFLNNYSNAGLISVINEDGSVSSQHEISNIARLPSDIDTRNALFYVRQSNTYYVFDTISGDLQQMELSIDNGYLIRSMFADGNNVVVKTRINYENKMEEYNEEIYVFEYNDLLPVSH